ncbi:MAG TPA: sugar nucleotide-binding protein [Xanthobacteraceae bacterium]|jgi:dTDP-4-dehydrorhamnose reductase|nr:sugar nucleotide-binding protein [Xanthobacteraceae bacterium]
MSVLVIGADGLVGAAIVRLLKASGRCVQGTTRRISQRDFRFLDLASDAVEDFALADVETAIVCAAVNGFARCRADPEAAYDVNVKATEILARRLAAQGGRLIYLSSSAVFDFRRPQMPAEAPHSPTSVYGKHKALAEDRVLAAHPSNTVVRLTKVLAPNTSHFGSWLIALHLNATVRAYSDLHFCPIALDYAANAIIKIMENGGGIYQVSGASDVSYAAAAGYLAKRIGRDESRVIAERAISDGIPLEEIARFTSLDASRFAALTGYNAPDPFEVMNTVFDPFIRQLQRA